MLRNYPPDSVKTRDEGDRRCIRTRAVLSISGLARGELGLWCGRCDSCCLPPSRPCCRVAKRRVPANSRRRPTFARSSRWFPSPAPWMPARSAPAGWSATSARPSCPSTHPGVILSLLVDAGDVVAPGQQLATLRRTSVGSNPTEAAQARENAERLLARNQALFEKGFVSQTAVDDARLAVERAQESTVAHRASRRRDAAPAGRTRTDGQRRYADPRARRTGAGHGRARGGGIARGGARQTLASAATCDSAALPQRAARRSCAWRRKATTRPARSRSKCAPTILLGCAADRLRRSRLRSGRHADAAIAMIVPTLSLLDARADQGIVFVVDGDNIARRRAVQTAGVDARRRAGRVDGLESASASSRPVLPTCATASRCASRSPADAGDHALLRRSLAVHAGAVCAADRARHRRGAQHPEVGRPDHPFPGRRRRWCCCPAPTPSRWSGSSRFRSRTRSTVSTTCAKSRSGSRAGVATIGVEFNYGADPEKKYDEVVRELNVVRPSLPDGVTLCARTAAIRRRRTSCRWR